MEQEIERRVKEAIDKYEQSRRDGVEKDDLLDA